MWPFKVVLSFREKLAGMSDQAVAQQVQASHGTNALAVAEANRRDLRIVYESWVRP
ncbi:MAG: hypothetical protein ACRYGI_11465 [Janthinobacterium lividum]